MTEGLVVASAILVESEVAKTEWIDRLSPNPGLLKETASEVIKRDELASDEVASDELASKVPSNALVSNALESDTLASKLVSKLASKLASAGVARAAEPINAIVALNR